jgi:very-short-patch-repair endonuclease
MKASAVCFYDLRDDLMAMFEKEAERKPLLPDITSKTPSKRYPALRKFYALAKGEIEAAERNQWGIDPYEVDWLNVFTPIEYGLWQDIRQTGAVLYPQYPVGRFFVDFGNPKAKVAVECDGAAFHTDKAKDAARDAELGKLGWRVYRISGRDCKKDFDEVKMECSDARKLIKRLRENYGI